MATTSIKYQVVFIIDISLANCKTCDHCNEVLLSVLRILSIFSESEKTIRAGCGVEIHWGFKLLNSSSGSSRKGQDYPTFKSYKLSHVESFEIKLRKAFESYINNSVTADNTKPKKCSVRSSDSQHLFTALNEILHDFKWNENDIFTSPVIRKGSQSKLFVEEGVIFKKYVFLMSKAPSSLKEMHTFSNKIIKDSDVFIDSFMSPALMKEYQNKFNISIHWIDLTSTSCHLDSESVDQNDRATAVAILKDSCKRLGGYFLSKDVILRFIPSYAKTCHLHSNIDPLQDLLNSFATESSLSKILIKDECSSHNKDNIIVILSGKSISDVACTLIPVSLAQNKRNISRNEECTSSSIHCAGYLREVNHLDLTEAAFRFQGCIYSSDASGLLMTYVLSGYFIEASSSEQMRQLIQHLHTSQTLGVITIKTKKQPFCNMGLLKPYAHGVGSLFILCSSANLITEKALLHYNEDTILKLSQKRLVKTDCSKQNLLEKLRSDLKRIQSVGSKGTDTAVENDSIFQSHCMNSWHTPGSLATLSSLISKLNERIGLDNPRSQLDKSFLKELQKHYAKEKQPPELVQHFQPSTSTPICAIRESKVNSGGSDSGSITSHHTVRHLRSSNLSRGRLMVDKARSASFAMADESNSSVLSAPQSPDKKLNFSSVVMETGNYVSNLKSEVDLGCFLKKQYEEVLEAGIAIESTIQTMVTVTTLFMSTTQTSNPQKSAVHFMEKHLLMTSTKLKEKYSMTSQTEQSTKIVEYKLQVMLLLELKSLLRDSDATQHENALNELAFLLRGLSFLIGATSLLDFLNNIVVMSYSSTVPQLLADVYDELMLPLPTVLAEFAAPGSVWADPVSLTNEDSLFSAPGSTQPGSHLFDHSSQPMRRCKFKQHPSISDFRQTRQILVKPKLKVETKKASKEKVKVRTSRRKHGGLSSSVDISKAKRNLFSDKAKATHSKSKEQATPRRKKKHKSSRHSDKPKTLALGTPSHKQTSQRLLQRQAQRRKVENNNPEEQVIAESPLKDDDDEEDHPAGTALFRPARYLLRESFYSSNSQPSRSIARSIELSQTSATANSSEEPLACFSRSQGTLSSAVRGESPLLSPRTRLVRSFISSPSPKSKAKDSHHSASLRRSPRKSVKKLEFKDNQSGSFCGRQNLHDARLIFDGENANDFRLLSTPKKGQSSTCYKTPEKQGSHIKPLLWDTSSCPLLTPTKGKATKGASPVFGFKNILAMSESKLSHLEKPGRKTPEKTWTSEVASNKLSALCSPDHSTRLRSSFSDRSPRRVTPEPASPYRSNAIIPDTFSPTRNKSLLAQKSDILSTPKKARIDENIFSTPKKLFSMDLKSHSKSFSTPSKVKFSDSCLVSTGSERCPPSSEKVTPAKSILKGSPSVKTKITRRVELQSVTGPVTLSPSFMGNTWHSSTRQAGKAEQNKKKSEAEARDKQISAFSLCSSDSCIEDNCASRASNTPAAITIHIPLPSSNEKIDSINKWARRKKCSAKNNSPLHSGSSSPSSPSNSDSMKKITLESPLNLGKENNGDSDLLGEPLAQSSSSFINKQTRKRGIFMDDKTESPNKRRKKSVSTSFMGRLDSQAFGHGDNPELIVSEECERFSDASVVPTGCFSQSSQETVSNSSLSQMASLPAFIMTPTKRVTRHCASSQEEGSQGFQVRVPSLLKGFSLQGANDSICIATGSSLKNGQVNQVYKMDNGQVNQVYKTDNGQVNQVYKMDFSMENQGLNLIKPLASAVSLGLQPTTPTQRSPMCHKPSVCSPEKKQFSPDLSAIALIHLIKSPLLSPSSVGSQERQHQRPARSKSRKHLDLK